MFGTNFKNFVSGISAVGVVVGGFLFFDARYTKAEDFDTHAKQETKTSEAVHKDVDTVLRVIQLQSITKMTILQQKAAAHTITPAEQIELDNLKLILDELNKRSSARHED